MSSSASHRLAKTIQVREARARVRARIARNSAERKAALPAPGSSRPSSCSPGRGGAWRGGRRSRDASPNVFTTPREYERALLRYRLRGGLGPVPVLIQPKHAP
jgi:hypothetical protein